MNSAEKHKKKGKLFVVSGPSGSGKSTLCKALVQRTDVQLSISATTRPKSDMETDGKNYYFLTEKEFREKIETDQLLEHACVFGHYYGTPAAPVIKELQQGNSVLLEIDVQGAAQVFPKLPQATGILVLPPSDEELKRRLVDRARDGEAVIAKRLSQAHREIDQATKSGNYHHTIINDDLDLAIDRIVAIVADNDT